MPNSSGEADRELLPLSYLSQYGYCPRRCALLLLDQVWADNEYTAAGTVQHQRVHSARTERRGGALLIYELWVYSRQLGVSGLCDCVEARPEPGGVPLPFGPGSFSLYPVEYKHGAVRDEWEYHIQLCAQAMCLEERYGCSIPAGAIFFIDAHRRDEIELTPQLRRETQETAAALTRLSVSTSLPNAQSGPKCRKCSLSDYCAPKLGHTAEAYCRKLLETITEEAQE